MMAEEKSKKKRLRGLAGILWNFFEPLNKNDYFKEKFADTEVKLMLNATDGRYAALIIIDKGTIDIENVPNKVKEDLKKKKLGWNGKLETDTQTLMDIAMEKLSLGGIVKKVLTRKIKIRGTRKLLILIKIFNILSYDEKKAKEAQQE